MHIMIARIEGPVSFIGEDSVVISACGVGYQVFATPDTLTRLIPGEVAGLYTYLSVRETALELFGFSSMAERLLFEMLLSVSGIGPRSALAILSLADPGTITGAIAKGNSAYLTTVSGIGRKTAEKIVVELRDKVGNLSLSEGDGGENDFDAIEALRSLGYTAQESRDALRLVPPEVLGTGKRITEALKHLGK